MIKGGEIGPAALYFAAFISVRETTVLTPGAQKHNVASPLQGRPTTTTAP
jgi:hypothetical protein